MLYNDVTNKPIIIKFVSTLLKMLMKRAVLELSHCTLLLCTISRERPIPETMYLSSTRSVIGERDICLP